MLFLILEPCIKTKTHLKAECNGLNVLFGWRVGGSRAWRLQVLQLLWVGGIFLPPLDPSEPPCVFPYGRVRTCTRRSAGTVNWSVVLRHKRAKLLVIKATRGHGEATEPEEEARAGPAGG